MKKITIRKRWNYRLIGRHVYGCGVCVDKRRAEV